MPTILQLNSTANWGSTGKIAEQINIIAAKNNWRTGIAYSRLMNPSQSELFQFGGIISHAFALTQARIFDNEGRSSVTSTQNLINRIVEVNPNIIHLHNLHGYYLNYRILFTYLMRTDIPVVWTLHDCWPFTGHCAYFDRIGCKKWKTECNHCPGLSSYPRSVLLDRSKKNYQDKKAAFSSILDHLTIVPVSNWLEDFVKQSFLRDAHIHTIHNGIDTNVFSPKDVSTFQDDLWLKGKRIVLGVAMPWSERKGLPDMIRLAQVLPKEEYQVILIGLSRKQKRNLPDSVIGIERTTDVNEMATYYSLASVFVNPTYEDNFPTTNLEALACGTPVVTYRTGGSPEAIDEATGIVVEQGDIEGLAKAIQSIDKSKYTDACRARAERLFDKDKCFAQYIDLYNSLLTK